MTSENFFERIHQQFNNNLPFVVYRRPNENVVNTLLQNDDDIHTVIDFSESGFVFAPFDNREDAVLIPFSESDFISRNVVIPANAEPQSIFDNDSSNAKRHHLKLIKKAISTINSKELLKVVLSHKEAVDISESNPIEIFKRLLGVYKTAFVYCWYHPKIGLWLGATPETLLKTEGKRFSTMALAGTQLYNNTLDVKWGSKEVEEQQLVTDFVANNLKKITDDLTVSKTETIKAGNLLHLKTKITGVFNNGIEEVLNVLHPTPAVCGLPKATAKLFILENENYNREFYTGFLGELNFTIKTSRNSNKRNVENNAYTSIKKISNLFVNLRCMQIKENNVLIYVGGGITKDSIPENEWQETVIKTHVVKKVLQ